VEKRGLSVGKQLAAVNQPTRKMDADTNKLYVWQRINWNEMEMMGWDGMGWSRLGHSRVVKGAVPSGEEVAREPDLVEAPLCLAVP
jgi:hypothetical protein